MESSAQKFISIEETDRAFEHWSTTQSLPSQIRRSIGQADVVIVPYEGFREYSGPVFLAGTERWFQFLRDKASRPDAVEIAIEDANYKEIALHSDLVTLATFLVTEVGFAFLAACLFEYLKKHICPRSDKQEVRACIIVDQSDATTQKAL